MSEKAKAMMERLKTNNLSMDNGKADSNVCPLLVLTKKYWSQLLVSWFGIFGIWNRENPILPTIDIAVDDQPCNLY